MGSSASITTAPDGTIWVADRCGAFGAGGTTCGGANAGVNPIFQFDTSGRLLKEFGAGQFISPHKLTIDKDGLLWMADNGSHQVFKLDQNGKILLTLGKKGTAGPGLDEFDAPTEVAIAPNGDIFVTDGHTGGGLAVGNARIVKFDRTGRFLKTWGARAWAPASSTWSTRWSSIRADVSSWATVRTTASRSSIRTASSSRSGSSSAGRAGSTSTRRPTRCTSRTRNRAMAERTPGRTRWRRRVQLQCGRGAGHQDWKREGRIRESLHPGSVPYPYPGSSSLAEGVTIDADGNIYGADYLMNVRKFVRK